MDSPASRPTRAGSRPDFRRAVANRQAVSPEAEGGCIWLREPQMPQQLRGVKVPGGFAARDQDASAGHGWEVYAGRPSGAVPSPLSPRCGACPSPGTPAPASAVGKSFPINYLHDHRRRLKRHATCFTLVVSDSGSRKEGAMNTRTVALTVPLALTAAMALGEGAVSRGGGGGSVVGAGSSPS